MHCIKCNQEFPDKDLQLSHDVPRYMFKDKNEADKHGRRYLCKKHHDIYEKTLFAIAFRSLSEDSQLQAINAVKKFAENYFNKGWQNDANRTIR